MINEVYLCIGGNLGNRYDNINTCLNYINKEVGTIKKTSSIYETSSWGVSNQPNYLNQVIIVESKLDPYQILTTILEIEIKMGRKRSLKWGNRVIDIDILSFNEEIVNTKNLKIPHPLIHQRKFVIIPILEINPQWIHPLLKKNIKIILNECNDEGLVKIY